MASGTVQTSTLTVANVQSLSVNGGTFDVNASFGSIPAVQVQTAGVLELDNGVTLTANVTNAGTLESRQRQQHRRRHDRGQLHPDRTGTLDIKLGGTAAGQYDALSVTGNVSLAGTLTVTLVNSFTPAAGDSFQIITLHGRADRRLHHQEFPDPWATETSSRPAPAAGAYTLSVIA